MRQVSRDEFFAALQIAETAQKRDIMPAIASGARWCDVIGYDSIWRDRSGRLFGKSNQTGYWLA